MFGLGCRRGGGGGAVVDSRRGGGRGASIGDRWGVFGATFEELAEARRRGRSSSFFAGSGGRDFGSNVGTLKVLVRGSREGVLDIVDVEECVEEMDSFESRLTSAWEPLALVGMGGGAPALGLRYASCVICLGGGMGRVALSFLCGGAGAGLAGWLPMGCWPSLAPMCMSCVDAAGLGGGLRGNEGLAAGRGRSSAGVRTWPRLREAMRSWMDIVCAIDGGMAAE